MKLKFLLGDERLLPRWLRNSVWAAAIFFAVGYLPTLWLKHPAVSMMLAAAGMTRIGAKSSSPLRAAGSGLWLGLLAGLAIGGALAQTQMPEEAFVTQGRRVELLIRMLVIFGPATAGLCAAVGLVFAFAARRRARLLEETWK
jgi:hypothetical protein